MYIKKLIQKGFKSLFKKNPNYNIKTKNFQAIFSKVQNANSHTTKSRFGGTNANLTCMRGIENGNSK
jgi:hypothetical protein